MCGSVRRLLALAGVDSSRPANQSRHSERLLYHLRTDGLVEGQRESSRGPA